MPITPPGLEDLVRYDPKFWSQEPGTGYIEGKPAADLIADMERTWRECMKYGGGTPDFIILPGWYFRRIRTYRRGRRIIKGGWAFNERFRQDFAPIFGNAKPVRDAPIPSTLPRR